MKTQRVWPQNRTWRKFVPRTELGKGRGERGDGEWAGRSLSAMMKMCTLRAHMHTHIRARPRREEVALRGHHLGFR